MAQYTLGQHGAEEFERTRLALLEEIFDPSYLPDEKERQIDTVLPAQRFQKSE